MDPIEIVAIVLIIVVGVPLMVPAFVAYFRYLKKVFKSFKEDKIADPISKEEATRLAQKEFYVAFKPYFELMEQGKEQEAQAFLANFRSNCQHKSRGCEMLHCSECPYGGLKAMELDSYK